MTAHPPSFAASSSPTFRSPTSALPPPLPVATDITATLTVSFPNLSTVRLTFVGDPGSPRHATLSLTPDGYLMLLRDDGLTYRGPLLDSRLFDRLAAARTIDAVEASPDFRSVRAHYPVLRADGFTTSALPVTTAAESC